MRRIGYLGVSVSLVLAFGVLGFSQARAPQPKSTAEYNGYMAVYNEPDAVKKAAAGEKFLNEFKESFHAQTHQHIIGAYSKAQNWAKVMEAADRAAASPRQTTS